MENFQLKFEAIGTHWVIDCESSESSISKEDLLSLILQRIELFDITYSRFRKDSLIWKISEKAGDYKFPEDSKEFFALYDSLYKITNGKFTLLVGSILNEAGYDSTYSLKSKVIHNVPKNEDIFTFEYPILNVKKPFILDFGGLGKGYLIEIIKQIILENDFESFTIDGGGDIYYQNTNNKRLRVGLENPNDFTQVIGVAEILNQSICASAGSRRKWEKFHHIIDPQTLKSPQNVLSTWVIADDALTADSMSTCLFLENPEKLRKFFDFEYLILYPDFTINKSEGFNVELF